MLALGAEARLDGETEVGEAVRPQQGVRRVWAGEGGLSWAFQRRGPGGEGGRRGQLQSLNLSAWVEGGVLMMADIYLVLTGARHEAGIFAL